MRLTLPLSAAAHVALIALLFLLPATVAAPPRIDLSNAIAVVFAPPTPPAPPPPPVVEQPPPAPEPPPPVIEQPPPPLAPAAETPPPPPPKPEPKPVPKPRPRPQPAQIAPQPMPQLPLPTTSQATAPQTASIPSPPPAISSDYRTVLSGWLESHKRYPEEARQRGEEGRAVLRFRVDRYGRVIDYSVVSGTGFGDLDAAVENMMRGATLPPFPPSMPQPEIEVSVTIRFGLAR